MPPKQNSPSTPFAQWLVEYADRHHTSLALMAQEAGLSRTTLYHYVHHSRNKPDLKVIVRLSEYTGVPAEKLARLAGVAGYATQKPVDPHLRELTNIYNRLPGPMQSYLLLNARQLALSMKGIASPPAQKAKK